MKLRKEDIYSAMLSAVTVLLISLFFCTMFGGKNYFERSLPVWFFLSGGLLSVLSGKIKVIKNNAALKTAVIAITAIIAGIITAA